VAAKWDMELFMWASSVLDSRTIWINGRKRCFLPMLDMVNNQDHHTRVHRTGFDERKSVTHTRAIWALKAGEQLFENYGSQNFHNLLFHGFILEHNSYDSAKLTLPQATGQLGRLLSGLGVPTRHEVKVGQGPPVSLMADARIRALDSSQVEDALAGRSRLNYGREISSSNEHQAVKTVLDACEQQLGKAYKTSGVDADIEILKDSTLTPNVRSAVTFRLQQKKIITRMCDQLKAQHDEL